MLKRVLACCGVLIVALGLLGCGAQGGPANRAATLTAPALQATPLSMPPNAETNGRAWGPPDAPIKVLKFVDFQCPTCAKYASEYEPGIVQAFAKGGQVRFEVRVITFIGPESYTAGMAALCAADQNAFWPMYHLIFESQPFERENTGKFSVEFVQTLAAQLGLDGQTFKQCLSSGQHKAQLQEDAAEAAQYEVARVPALVIDGKLYADARNADDLRQIFAQTHPTLQLRYTP